MKKNIWLNNFQKTCIGLAAFSGLCFITTIVIFAVKGWSAPANIFRAVFEFAFSFVWSFIFLLIGVAFIGYEGAGTPINMIINGLFYFFLVCWILFLVLLVTSLVIKFCYKDNKNKNKVEIST